MAADKDGVAVNQRKQTLKELLTQSMHYSERVRKGRCTDSYHDHRPCDVFRYSMLMWLHNFVAESLMGLKDLFARFPTELPMHAMAVVEKLSPRITDYDKAVRQTLLMLLRTTILPGLPQVFFSELCTIEA